MSPNVKQYTVWNALVDVARAADNLEVDTTRWGKVVSEDTLDVLRAALARLAETEKLALEGRPVDRQPSIPQPGGLPTYDVSFHELSTLTPSPRVLAALEEQQKVGRAS